MNVNRTLTSQQASKHNEMLADVKKRAAALQPFDAKWSVEDRQKYWEDVSRLASKANLLASPFYLHAWF